MMHDAGLHIANTGTHLAQALQVGYELCRPGVLCSSLGNLKS